eukprot:SAG31_NODE_32032_length_361_cov_0.583969_2_plen_29_part_01
MRTQQVVVTTIVRCLRQMAPLVFRITSTF